MPVRSEYALNPLGESAELADRSNESKTFNEGRLCCATVRPPQPGVQMTVAVSTNPDSRPALPPTAPHVRLSAMTDNGRASCVTDVPIILVGSRRDCGLPLPHPDVSKIHCAIVNTGQAILVCDLHSRSGTFVNGASVRTAVLHRGDTLRLGPAEVTLEFPRATNVAGKSANDARHLELPTPLVFETAQQRIEVTRAVAVVGRRHTADVRVDTPDVSLAHALLFIVDGHPVVCDLGSRSGTVINGERVELAWINDGDELSIGGESLKVGWKHRAPSNRQPRDQAPAAHAGLVATVPADLSNLSDLERTMAAVQSQISTARGKLEEQKQQLDEREADLDRRSADLAPQREALAKAEEDLRRREQKLQRDHAELPKQKAALEQQRQSLAEAQETARLKDEELQKRELEVQTSAEEVAQERQSLEADRTDLANRLAEQQTAAEELARQTEELVARAAAIESRSRELDTRESELNHREAHEGETRQKIEQFKVALSRASEMFNADAPAEQSTAVKRSVVPSHPTAARDEPLPAPMVDQPLFAGESVEPPSDWPQELRDRFQVLRRVSTKSDEELRAQVWAERGKVLSEESGNGQRRKKKSRFRWAN